MREKSVFTKILIIAFIVFGIATEVFFICAHDQPLLRTCFKALVAVCAAVLCFYAYRPDGNILNSHVPALIAALLGDVLIGPSFVVGVILFLICHLLLSIYFLRKKNMSKAMWIIWAAFSLVIILIIILIFAKKQGIYAWGAAVYAPVLLLMVFSCLRQTRRMCINAFLFMFADILLAVYNAVWKVWPLHAVQTVLFYGAILMLATYKETE